MKKASKFTKGLQGRMIGIVIGGAGNAVFDKYVTPRLPDSMKDSPDMIKIVAGIGLPFIFKGNSMVDSLATGLATVGIANLVGSYLPDIDKTAAAGVGRANAAQVFFEKNKNQQRALRSATPERTSVGNAAPERTAVSSVMTKL